MKVLVTGATGYIGGRLVPRLLDKGHEVTVLVRNAQRARSRAWASRVAVIEGDLLDPPSLEPALRDVEGAYYLVHSMQAGPDFAERDRRAADTFAEAAGGVRRVIYLGGLVPAGGSDHETSEHLRSRAEVGEVLRARVDATEFRAGPIIGSGSASFEMVRYLTERLPAMVAPRWITNEVQPIAVDDVLDYLVAALEAEGAAGVIDIGMEPMSFKEMMQGYAKVRGLERIILPLPILAPKLAALWVGLVTPISNSLAVPLVEGMVEPLVGNNDRARSLFPDIHPLDYPTAVGRALDQIESGSVSTRWSGTGGAPPDYELVDREGMMHEVRTVYVDQPPDVVFRAFSSLGGDTGWLVWEWAWALRGWLDQLIGGPGLRRGRRHPTELLEGEAVDFWRVEAVDAPRLLRLRAEMKLPGDAWLQFEANRKGSGTELVQTASFAPRGAPGAAYWYGIYPFHAWIFNDMVKAVASHAERLGEREEA